MRNYWGLFYSIVFLRLLIVGDLLSAKFPLGFEELLLASIDACLYPYIWSTGLFIPQSLMAVVTGWIVGFPLHADEHDTKAWKYTCRSMSIVYLKHRCVAVLMFLYPTTVRNYWASETPTGSVPVSVSIITCPINFWIDDILRWSSSLTHRGITSPFSIPLSSIFHPVPVVNPWEPYEN